MFIETLGCQNFRNYELLDISFGQHTNILYGENAQGKTNILEAIYMAKNFSFSSWCKRQTNDSI